MSTYRFRAETVVDVLTLLERVHARRVEIAMLVPELPDVEVTLDDPSIAGNALDLAALRSQCAAVPDGHVMAQTADTLAQYSRERRYEVAPMTGGR